MQDKNKQVSFVDPLKARIKCTHTQKGETNYVFWYVNLSQWSTGTKHPLPDLPAPVEWGEHQHLFLPFKALSKSVDKVSYYTLTSENTFASLFFK